MSDWHRLICAMQSIRYFEIRVDQSLGEPTGCIHERRIQRSKLNWTKRTNEGGSVLGSIPMIPMLKDLRGMYENGLTVFARFPARQEWNRTSSICDTTLNTRSWSTVKFNAPSNSRSIRATVRLRPVASLIMVSADPSAVRWGIKLGLIADRCRGGGSDG